MKTYIKTTLTILMSGMLFSSCEDQLNQANPCLLYTSFADNFMVDSVTVTMINDFTPIEVKDLPAAVQEAITKNYACLLYTSRCV